MEFKVLLNSIEKIRIFSGGAMVCDFDIDIVSGRYVINGKSIMGIFSLDLSKPINVRLSNGRKELYDEFVNKLKNSNVSVLE